MGPNKPESSTHGAPQASHSSTRRYFIMKCLSHREIEWSVRTNLWITQKHNEVALNDAIKVYSPPYELLTI